MIQARGSITSGPTPADRLAKRPGRAHRAAPSRARGGGFGGRLRGGYLAGRLAGQAPVVAARLGNEAAGVVHPALGGDHATGDPALPTLSGARP
jgi:hypothetical protein